MPILRWLESEDIVDNMEEKRRLCKEYIKSNPLMGCSQMRSCVTYHLKLPDHRVYSRTDQDYGVDKCNLWYGCRFACLPQARQMGALNRKRLSCFRGGRFYVKNLRGAM